MKEGDIVWVLKSIKNTNSGVRKCLYRGHASSYTSGVDNKRCNLQYIRKDGGLGMSFSESNKAVFKTLDDLKEYALGRMDAHIQDLISNIKDIKDLKKEFSELKDIQEDREKKLNQIL